MNLPEYEGKKILAGGGICVPSGRLFSVATPVPDITYPVFAKAQILSSGRMGVGGVLKANNSTELGDALSQLLGKEVLGHHVEHVLVEEAIVRGGPEYFVSFSCDADSRGVLLRISNDGGTGIEDRPPQIIKVDYLKPNFKGLELPEELLQKLFDIFCANDCLLLEINPLVREVATNKWVALDAKIVLDDLALPRHSEKFTHHTQNSEKTHTKREIEAKKIDEDDHRGSAGSSFVDLDGDIGMLPSGGGASLLAMDALFAEGGRPANYTEYSGNPTGEKVRKLVSIVVSKPELHALWVVGAVANFTDIYETLRGLIEGLRNARATLGLPIDYPIVIRRGGPRDKEAYAMLHEITDFDIHVFGEETSIEASAKIVVQLAHAYHETHKSSHTK